MPAKNVKGGTQLAKEFNLLHRGEAPVSPQTAHKWLTGTTIPTPDKLQTLADWLGVGCTGFTTDRRRRCGIKTKPLAPWREVSARRRKRSNSLPKIEALDPKDRNFVEEFVDRLYDAGKEESRASTCRFQLVIKKAARSQTGRLFYGSLLLCRDLGGRTRDPARRRHQAALVFD